MDGKSPLVRIFQPHDGNGEMACLRLILMYGPTRTPWGENARDQLRTVAGVKYDTWREVAQAIGLFGTAARVRTTVHEATTQLVEGGDLRDLLAILLAKLDEICEVQPILDEFLRELCGTDCVDMHALYRALHRALLKYKSTLLRFLPSLTDLLKDVTLDDEDCSLAEHMDKIAEVLRDPDQKAIFDHVVEQVRTLSTYPRFCHIEAPAGCGKTFLAVAIAAYLKKEVRLKDFLRRIHWHCGIIATRPGINDTRPVSHECHGPHSSGHY